MLSAAKLELDDAVTIRVEDQRIIIEPVPKHAPELSELLGGITPENLHGELDFGPAIGREAM